MKFDLGVFENQVFELTLGGDIVCSIKKPSKKMILQLKASEVVIQNTSASLIDRMEAMDKLILVLFNHNTEGKVFTANDVDVYDFHAQLQIYKAYFSWCYSQEVAPN